MNGQFNLGHFKYIRIFMSNKCIDWKDVNRKKLLITQFLQCSHQIHYLSAEFFSETLFLKLFIVCHRFYFVVFLVLGHSLPNW